MLRVTFIVCHVSIQYDDTCQIIVWISIWFSYLFIWFDL